MVGSLIITTTGLTSSNLITIYGRTSTGLTQQFPVITGNINNLYTLDLYQGDYIKIKVTGSTIQIYTVSRVDYTFDDVNGDNGIKESLVGTSINGELSFTIPSLPNDYNFEYRINFEGDCFDYGSGLLTKFSPIIGNTNFLVQPDGKIILGGFFKSYNGYVSPNLIRIYSGGTIDETFNVGVGTTGGTSESIANLKLQSTGKIIINGNFQNYNGNLSRHIARVNTDGSFDTTFNSGNVGYSFSIMTTNASYINSDDSILIGQNSANPIVYNGITVPNGIMKLNSNGTLDTSFNSGGAGANNIVNEIITLSSGKILIAGSFTDYNGTTIYGIARLNSNGTLDTSFTQTNSNINAITGMVVQSTGKIVISGNIGTDGINRQHILRLNTDGSIDNSFTPTTGFAGVDVSNVLAWKILRESDDSMIITGTFTSYNGVSYNGLIKLNQNGIIDTSFNIGTGFGTDRFSLNIIKYSNYYYISGPIIPTYNGYNLKGLVRIKQNGTFNDCS